MTQVSQVFIQEQHLNSIFKVYMQTSLGTEQVYNTKAANIWQTPLKENRLKIEIEF